MALGTGFELATRLALVTVLLAQAVAIVAAAPWSEGDVLLSLGARHGLTVGDLPAFALVIVAGLVILLSTRRARPSLPPGRRGAAVSGAEPCDRDLPDN